MASLPSALLLLNPVSYSSPTSTIRRGRGAPALVMAMAAEDDGDKLTKLVTFLGKGGSGKTTSAVFAAQHYAMAGLSTCLVIHTQDPTAEYLLNCKIGSSPIVCNRNLSALRFETTKMLLEPLSRLKQADARLNMTQGVLERIIGEELGVLPGMDPIFSLYALERLVGFFRNVAQKNHYKDKFDIIIYDGMSSEEIIRMISAASKARLYLKYLRNLAKKTDLGRLAGPSLLRLVDEAMNISGSPSLLNGKISAEIWDTLERMLERGSSVFSGSQKFGCFLVMDPDNPTSVNSALRYWGCAIQAGAHVSGALGIASPHLHTDLQERAKETFSPLPFAFIPHLSIGSALDWNTIVLNSMNGAWDLLSPVSSSSMISPVKFDAAKKSVTLLMPGFDKSEIKLYQYRGGSELLVEAGDQRRVIQLPSEIQGKVAGLLTSSIVEDRFEQQIDCGGGRVIEDRNKAIVEKEGKGFFLRRLWRIDLNSRSIVEEEGPTSTIRRGRGAPALVMAMAAEDDGDKLTKLVTFLGKGGSGKTTSAVFAAQHYAMAGLSTCLVIHTQDPTAEYLLNCKIGSSPIVCNRNLSALRFETTKMLLEPLSRLKQADARLNMTQGVLERIIGEELGVLPGMDPIFSLYALERLVGFFRNVAQKNHYKDKFDIIIYDGMSSEEIIRMISAASKARCAQIVLKISRNLAKKTDLGRLAGPSLLRLVDEAMNISGSPSLLNGKISAEIWDTLEQRVFCILRIPKFGCFLVMDPDNPTSVNSALRYWGCAIQAGAHVSGALGIASPHLHTDLQERAKETFSPLPFAFIPHLSIGSALDWNTIVLNSMNGAWDLLSPGGSELLVEAGDQRRVIQLPSEIQGKVAGAKFIDRSIIITMR
ncbi:hypothetical protein FNV43_RR27314 [Rhamnella rubrinervis]|uniref:Uncharacterized protein n=1 Tax=Rhamnella rubrinervis TaxID=2594499 RepID=A0A8K0DR17_9ROSA|nr:hypothetical protein FNV43_RR27314 [Rhamnella rubrinervis]